MSSSNLITIDGIARTKTTLDGTERLAGRDGSGDFKTLFSAIKQYIDSSYENIVAFKSSSYAILDSDIESIFIFSGASSNGVFTMPAVADSIGRILTLFNNDSTYMLTAAGDGSETIEGMSTIQLPKRYNYIKLLGTSGGWLVLDEAITCQLRLHTYAGFGSTDTKIMRYSTLVESIGNFFSENHSAGYNSNTKGLEVSILRSGRWSVEVTYRRGSVSTIGGVSLNAPSLTTNFESIASGSVSLCGGTASSQVSYSIGGGSITMRLDENDILRPHADGVAPAANSERCHFILTWLGK